MTAFMHERHACEPAGEIAPDGLPSALPAERALTCRHGRHELDEVRLPRARHEPDRRQGVPGRNRVDDGLNGGCGNSGSPRTDGCFNDQTTKTTQLKIGPAGHWSLGHWIIGSLDHWVIGSLGH